MARKINKAGIDLVKSFEGLRLKPYLCSAKVPTIGYGTTFYEDGKKVTLNDPEITESRAEQLLTIHMDTFAASVEKLAKVPLTDNQFGALCSFVYNLGAGALGQSTLLKKLNAKDYAGAATEFEKWNKERVGGVLTPSKGLTRRRQAEKALFLQSPANQKQTSLLGNGPSEEDIQVKLDEIEKEIL
jgi:lysozyme